MPTAATVEMPAAAAAAVTVQLPTKNIPVVLAEPAVVGPVAVAQPLAATAATVALVVAEFQVQPTAVQTITTMLATTVIPGILAIAESQWASCMFLEASQLPPLVVLPAAQALAAVLEAVIAKSMTIIIMLPAVVAAAVVVVPAHQEIPSVAAGPVAAEEEAAVPVALWRAIVITMNVVVMVVLEELVLEELVLTHIMTEIIPPLAAVAVEAVVPAAVPAPCTRRPPRQLLVEPPMLRQVLIPPFSILWL